MDSDSARPTSDHAVDPVIEAYKPGIDRTILRENLKLTITERIDNLQSLMKSIAEMQEMGRRARERRDAR
jgi:hypothetical protein